MRDRRKLFEYISYVGVILWAVYLLVQASNWGFRTRIIPIVAGWLLVLLATLQLLKLRFPTAFERFTPADQSSRIEELLDEAGISESDSETRNRDAIVMVIWVTALPFLIFLFGFLYVVPIYLAAFTVFLTRDVRATVVIVSITLLFTYVLFTVILNVQFWEGALL